MANTIEESMRLCQRVSDADERQVFKEFIVIEKLAPIVVVVRLLLCLTEGAVHKC